jgi:hypothetical protein
MGKRIAILQSNYIPWKGYFDLIKSVDEFILYDTAQYTKNDWRNRNRIKTSRGLAWLTIPVFHRFGQLIQDTVVSDAGWGQRHWGSLLQNYSAASHFGEYKGFFEAIYKEGASEPHLSAINHRFLTTFCGILGITTPITWSRDYRLADGQTERLVDLCRQTRATHYLSGPAARAYLNVELFTRCGIEVSYIDYSGYPEYPQLFAPFEHGVSVLDLIFNVGGDAPRYMKSFHEQRCFNTT